MKPGFAMKFVDWQEYDAGRPCLKKQRTKPIEAQLRMLESQAKLPIQHSIFSVRGGKAYREELLYKLRKWHKERPQLALDVKHDIYPMFHRLIENNAVLDGYAPLWVKCQRNQTHPESKRTSNLAPFTMSSEDVAETLDLSEFELERMYRVGEGPSCEMNDGELWYDPQSVLKFKPCIDHLRDIWREK